MTIHHFPRGFFTPSTFATLSTDTLALAATMCETNAQAAPRGSRSAGLWQAHCEQLVRAIGERGRFAAKIDAHSPYVALTRDEYTALVNSPSRMAAGQRFS